MLITNKFVYGRCFYFCIFCVLIAFSITSLSCKKAQNNTAVTLAAMDLIRSGTASKLEVLCVPKEEETMVALYPELLEKTWSYKITFRDFQFSPIKKDLISALEDSSITQTNVTCDLRWACIFYNTNDVRVLSIYFDGDSKKGLIEGKSVISNGKFVRVLEQRCSYLWK